MSIRPLALKENSHAATTPAFPKSGEIHCLLFTETSDLYESQVVHVSFWSPFLLFIFYFLLWLIQGSKWMGLMVLAKKGGERSRLTSAFLFRLSRFSFQSKDSSGWNIFHNPWRDSSLIDQGISNSTHSHPDHSSLESILGKETLLLLILISGWYQIGLFPASYP